MEEVAGEVAGPRVRAHEDEKGPQQGGVDDDPKEFLRWLGRSAAELGLLPALPGFDATALVARWTEIVAPRLWRRDPVLVLRVFEVIHRHPRFAQPRPFEQSELERLVDEATKHRAGRARFQSILLFNESALATPANGTDSQVLLERAIAHAKRIGRIKP